MLRVTSNKADGTAHVRLQVLLRISAQPWPISLICTVKEVANCIACEVQIRGLLRRREKSVHQKVVVMLYVPGNFGVDEKSS